MCRKCLSVNYWKNNEDNEEELLKKYGKNDEDSIDAIVCNEFVNSKHELKNEGIKITTYCESGISVERDKRTEKEYPAFVLDMWIGNDDSMDNITVISRKIKYCPYCGEKLVEG